MQLKADIVPFITKFFRLRWCGHFERTQNQQMPKQTATATVEGTREKENTT
jgi:hypothetical protein